MLAVAWQDHGADLGHGPASPWLTNPLRTSADEVSFLPVIQQSQRVLSQDAPHAATEQSMVPQTARSLHLTYRHSLDGELACQDSFYAMSEFSTFAASSELQLLNLLQEKIAMETDPSVLKKVQDRSLSNLLYSKQILDRHIIRPDENIQSLHTHQTWPHSTTVSTNAALKAKADSNVVELLADYNFLLGYTRTLSQRCESGMQVVMQYVMLRESQKAIEQAIGVTRLTRLAFVYIPLSFASTFFGMNFKEFGTGKLSIWVYFVMSVPVFLVSIIWLQWEGLKRMQRRRLRRLSKVSRKLKVSFADDGV